MKKEVFDTHYIEDDLGNEWTEEVENALHELKEKLDFPTEEIERTVVERMGVERRKAKRVEIRVPISTTNGNRITESFTTDMNYNGCFIETEAPHRVGDSIEISLQTNFTGIGELSHGTIETETIRAVVRWQRAKVENPNEYSGMGVQFVSLTQEQKNQIQKILLISETETLMSYGEE